MVELFGLNASFQTVKALRCVNIQWNRRYYEAGDFAIQLCAADWDTSIAYVYTGDRPETGMVEKVETEHNVKGDFVHVSGFFLEGMLNWEATFPKYKSTGNVSAACKALVTTYMASHGVTVPAQANIGTSATFESEGEQLGDATYAALKAKELSQRIRYDRDANSLKYEVWQGLNRTQSQSVNPYAVFSQNFGTVDALTLTQDVSAYRNYAIGVYDGGHITVDLRAAGEHRRVLYVDTGMSKDEEQTQADFLDAVETEVRKQLAEFPAIVNVEASVLQSNSVYLVDYNLGDKCDAQDDHLQLAFETRIIEVNEVWKAGKHEVSLQFGDKIPTIYRRGRA